MEEIDRRTFLLGSVLAPFLGGCTGLQTGGERPLGRAPILDIHIHLFGAGDGGSGCILSRTIQEGPLFKLLSAMLRLRERARTIDEGYVDALVEHLEGAGLDRGVVLAQDGVYDRSGRRDDSRTHAYVPNDYLFEVTGRHPDLMIPCVSINPDRRDHLEELEACAERGARILKIHPPIQGVDVSDAKHERFFVRCAELGIVVMVHTGHEHAAPVVDIDLANPRRLERALDLGCLVVASHCGTGWAGDEPDYLGEFVRLVRKYENLYGDTSVLGSKERVEDFKRLVSHEEVLPRLVHGSDFPFISWPVAFWERLGMAAALEIQGDANWIRRDFRLKEALIGRVSAERAYRLVHEGV